MKQQVIRYKKPLQLLCHFFVRKRKTFFCHVVSLNMPWWWSPDGAPTTPLWRHCTVGPPPRSRLSTFVSLLFCVLPLTTRFLDFPYVFRPLTFAFYHAYGYLLGVGHAPSMLNHLVRLLSAILHVARLLLNHCG